MNRVLVIGSGGAGKTTVARTIAESTGLPLVHLDRLYWQPGWVATPAVVFEQVVRDVVADDEWVIDGNYGGTMSLRLATADTVVFLDVPRVRCLVRVLTRAVRDRRRTRDDMAPGCRECVTWDFVRWIWMYPATSRPGLLSLLEDFERRGGRTVILRSDAEIQEFVSSIRTTDRSS